MYFFISIFRHPCLHWSLSAVLQSLQTPLLALVAEVAKSANGSHFNSSDALGRLQLAIERTVQDATQVGPHLEANGTLECNSLLKAWEPVREVAGLSRASMAVWCNISLQPAIATHTAALNVYPNGNMSHTGVELAAVNATAGRIVGTLRSLYQVNINCTHVSRALIMAISTQLSTLELQPPSPEVQAEWHQRFLDMQLLQSLASIQMLSDRLLPMATSFHVYTESLDRALSHLLSNLQLLQNPNFTHHVFSEAAMIFLSSANISGGAVSPVMWENFSGLDAEALVGVLREVVKVVIHAKLFGDVPTVYQTLNHFVASNSTRLFAMKVAELVAWWSSTRASEVDLLTQVLPRMYEAFRAFLSTLDQMGLDLSATTELIEDIVGNLLATIRQMVSTSDLPEPTHNQPPWGFRPPGNHHNVTTQWRDPGVRVRRRREAPPPPIRMPLDDFLDLFYIDYPALIKALSVPPSPSELMETAHMFFANPDLSVVMKGVTRDMSWGLNASKGETIDTVLGVLTYLTHPEQDPSQLLSVEVLKMLADVLPAGLPFSEVVKNVTGGLARESRENQILLWQVAHTAAELLNTSVTDRRFWWIFDRLTAQVCVLERTESLRHLMRALYMEPGQLCGTILPSLQVLAQSLMSNGLELSGDALLQTFVGEPNTYRIDTNWTSVFSQGFGLNASSLSALNINITSPVVVRVGELLRNKTAFTLDVHRHLTFDPHTLHLLLNTSLPNSNLVILSWLVNLRHCSHSKLPKANQTEEVIYRTFCSMSAQQWFSFLLLMARHVNTEQLIYRMVLSEDLQSVVGVMLQMTKFLTGMMGRLAPAISRLQDFLLSIQNLNLVADPEFRNVVRGYKTRMSSRSTLTTLSRAMCNKGILALFGIAKLSSVSESDPSLPSHHRREEMIEQFKIPRNATPFCMNLYLDMVNTTGGAIAWAFLKPMLMGQVLFTPDTPLTRDIMEKSNKTLQEFANLKTYSEDWIQSSDYIMKSARLLRDTLPLLQNSLGNAFVKNFIEMQTDINVGHMKETLSNFSNMTVLLEKNKHVLRQITTLSNLMVNISSCVKFDRFRGFDSADELNAVAQHLAKNRDLYAGVIFKLPEGESSSSSSSSTTSLPPKVRYTIRMHMDNVMRTDRTRNPYYVKDTHVSARQTLRYNRGFIYLQESIDRAIIETQAGRVVAEPAVQLQPFPYPCFLRDE